MSSALPLTSALGRGDVVEHHVAEALLHREQRQVAADLPAADEANLLLASLSHVSAFSADDYMFLMMA